MSLCDVTPAYLCVCTYTCRRTRAKTAKLLRILERQEWIDTRTRAVFVEFTLYNANVNLFASVIMGVEWMAAGSAVTKAEVKVSRARQAADSCR